MTFHTATRAVSCAFVGGWIACSPSPQPVSAPPATVASTAPAESMTAAPEASSAPVIASAPAAPAGEPAGPPPPSDAPQPGAPMPHAADAVSGASVKHHPIPEPPKDGACPANFAQLKDTKSEPRKCKCPAKPPNGSVWGTSVYTSDSSICGAAVHVGAIKADKGGEVTVKYAPGCGSYAATAKNGVQSSAWGAWGSSFFFPGFGDGKCAAVTGDECPPTFATAKSLKDGQLTCKCPANASGTLYGSMVYTSDSALCAAAVHAGAIPKTGGKVTAKSLGGCSTYESTTKNGLTSTKWGPYGASFFFPGFGPGKCP